MQTYECLCRMMHDGRRVVPGDLIEVSDRDARGLLGFDPPVIRLVEVTPEPEPNTPDPPTQESNLLNLNTATSEALQGLPRIGPSTASKLIKGRPYADLGDAQAASELSDDQWGEVAPLVEV